AYREVLATHPDLKPCWAEYFELLRSAGRPEDALRLAEEATAQLGEGAFPLALKGAALIELARFPDALAGLERAVAADPGRALVWHELGYAAYRLGDPNRALLALDRAFALEPHTETLKLRGRILREAGRYAAAEVAFEAAAQAAEHREQREEAEREILATRRYAFWAPRRPDDLQPAERWFAETGAVVLAPVPGPVPPSDEALAKALGAPLVGRDGVDPPAVPLVAALRPLAPEAGWSALTTAITEAGAGLVFVLEHPAETPSAVGADVIGVLTDAGQRRSRMPQPRARPAGARPPRSRPAGPTP